MGLLGDNLPNWLPDDPNKNAAMRAGLLNFGAALMGGRGNLGQILGGGLMAGSQGYAGSMDSQQKQALQAAQMNHYGLESKVLQNTLDEPMNLQRIIGGTPAPMPVSAPSAASALASGNQDMAPAPQPAADAETPPTGPRAVMPVSALPQVGQVAQAAPTPPGPTVQSMFQNYIGIGDRLTNAGKPAAAKQYYELAQKMRPEVQEVKTALDGNGKPVQVITFKDGSQQTSSYGALPENQVVDLGNKQVLVDKNTGKSGASFDKAQSPDSVATNATTRRGQDLTHSDNTAGDQAPITDAAILNAAARYNLDGTLPPMGMGKNAAAGRSAILNKAAEMASGVDPSQQRRDQLSFKGDTASQNAAVKAFTSGKQGNSVRSFNVSLSHLDTLSSLADALHNNDSKMVNKFSNYIAEQTGNPAPTNFDAAKKIVGDEVVKAIVGSGGGVHDREEAARVIAAANSPAQLKGAIGTYKELMRGQLDGLQQQYEASTGRKDFNRFLSQHAQDTRVSSPSTTQKTAADHPSDISNLLQKYGAQK